MYQGIIQESQWTPRGSYLRAKIEQYQLDKVNQSGRIWRLRYDGYPAGGPSTPASPAIRARHDAAAHAERDAGAAAVALRASRTRGGATARSACSCSSRTSRSCPRCRRWCGQSDTLMARFHALWTLEGLGALDAATVAPASCRSEPAHARAGASRERDALQGWRQVVRGRLQERAQGRRRRRRDSGDAHAQRVKVPGAIATIRPVVAGEHGPRREGNRRAARRAQRRADGRRRRFGGPGGGRGGAAVGARDGRVARARRRHLRELCFSCHGEDGRGAPLAGGEPGADARAVARGRAAREWRIATTSSRCCCTG